MKTTPVVLTRLTYLAAITATTLLVLAVIGSSPLLLDRLVPERHRATVAGLGVDAPRLSGLDAHTSPGHALPGSGLVTVASTDPVGGAGWSPHALADVVPPPGLTPGADFEVRATPAGFVAHWPCGEEIPVRSFDAPPGSEADLAWAVETVARASGLDLRYAGPGAAHDREGYGAISVTYGDHPAFLAGGVGGVSGPTVWDGGRITRGSVTLRPDQIGAAAGDAWTRSLTLHELLHAVGLGHAAQQRPEVMAPSSGPVPRTALGPGDLFALGVVGCR